MSQFSFDFFAEKTDEFRREDFLLLPENAEIVTYLKRIFEQKNYSEATLPSLLIRGESGSGKTHLLHAMNPGAQSSSSAMPTTVVELELRVPGELLTEEEITGVNLLNFFQPNQFYFFENIDEIKNEELLLNLINSASEVGAFLILTTRLQPNFQIKDLTSRVKNMAAVEIKNPSQESVKQLLMNQLARRQIKLPTLEIGKILRDIERNYRAIIDAAKMAEFRQKEGKF